MKAVPLGMAFLLVWVGVVVFGDVGELDFSGFDVVEGADGHEAFVFFEVDEDLGFGAEFLD